MAAKQGLSAQISQASEDAKRAVLNRTSLTTSLWFSNLNTTCTIKSAPPRTPEVLSLLSTKSGWLFKRNEQHVWQTRWCCVVPHTFLYYFDASVLPEDAQPPLPSSAQQDDWNNAVANGYPHHRGKGKQAPRSSLYLGFNSGGAGATSTGNNKDTNENHHENNSSHEASSPAHAVHPTHPAPNGMSSESFASMQPAGIIDLECYTSVHRSQQNQLVLELAGDDAVNPDLRQFYFCAGNEHETEDWTQALLGQRHSALMDETEAYKQVCDGFAQQLQQLHMEMDHLQKQTEDAQEELYQVRSAMEEGRRSCWKVVEEVLDKEGTAGTPTSSSNGRSFRADLNAIRSQDITLLAPAQLLADYTRQLEDSCQELSKENESLKESMAKATDSDHDKVLQLEQELADAKNEMQQREKQWQHEKQVLQQKLDKSTKELQDLNKDLASTRMEVTMYQSSTRNKITELQNHKKILKKEVIDLRQKLEDSLSELSLLKHKEKTSRLEVDQERKKAELLERYVEKVESQVKVQQNMMEMMSNSGVGSIHGGNGSHYEVAVPHSVHSPSHSHSNQYKSPSRRNVLLVNTPSNVGDDDHKDKRDIRDADAAGLQLPDHNKDAADEEDEEEGGAYRHHHSMHGSPLLRRAMLDDSDNKSHLSELTEDRTQKQFDAIHYLREQQQQGDGPRLGRYSSPRSGPSPPPAYIVGGNNNSNSDRYHNSTTAHQQQLLQNFQNPEQAKLDTIHHSSATAVTTPSRMQPMVPRPSPRDRDTPPHHVMVDHQSYKGGSSRSLGAGNPGRLSVAQRARLQAERGSTPVKVRLDQDNQNNQSDSSNKPKGPPPTSQNSPIRRTVERRHSNSSQSRTNNFFSNIGRKLEAAIDKSVFSVDVHDTSDDDDDNLSSTSRSSRASRSGEDDRSHNEENNGDNNPATSEDEDEIPKKGGRGPALLTQETLDGHNQRHSPSKAGDLGGGKTTTSAPAFGTPRRKDYTDSIAGSSIVSGGVAGEEKKTPTPDSVKVCYSCNSNIPCCATLNAWTSFCVTLNVFGSHYWIVIFFPSFVEHDSG